MMLGPCLLRNISGASSSVILWYPFSLSTATAFQKRVYSGSEKVNNQYQANSSSWIYKLAGAVGIGAATYLTVKHFKETPKIFVAHAATKAYPVYKMADVSKHSNKEVGGIWCSFNGKVYDITNFIDEHPGGDKILLAAGGALEPFWNLFAVHKADHVYKMLDELQIGVLDPADQDEMKDLDDPYANDPKRHPALKAASKTPFNAEAPHSLIGDSFLTPNELFFVRNHLPVPEVDLKDYRLEVCGNGMKTREFTLDELKKKFKHVKVAATLQCAGNRRHEMNFVKEVKGLRWGHGAISNAEWEGVRLRDVLEYCGINVEKNGIKHIQFEGLDLDPTGEPYGSSILARKAMDPHGDVIIAFSMNGEPIPVDHGFPLRVVVPGIVGARNVKWLSRINASDKESSSFWQQKDYKLFCPSADMASADFSKAQAIQEAPVQSAIADPIEGTKIKKGSRTIEMKGYAWSGGGRGIVRVDVSLDGGKTWQSADLQQDPNQPLDRMWAWTLWKASLPLPSDRKNPVELVVKAVDTSYNNQPDNVAGVWNVRGCLNNSWHRVKLQWE